MAVLHAPLRTRLLLSGEVDVSMNAELNQVVEDAMLRAVPVDVDSRAVTFMDSSVVAMLARLAYRLPYRLQVIEPPELVRFLLDVTELGDIVDVVEQDPGFPGDGTTATGAPPAA
ncbi:STAS domain-containing protein [Georgenia sp. AZ-5]|uniref:STAS domain-containing protein n=1 Tax=Georgenia sp. AZ-5 TaxID=3367526 RepID=UPI003753E9CC